MAFNSLSDLKIGMRVRCVFNNYGNSYSKRFNKIGTIISFNDYDPRINICWDDGYESYLTWTNPNSFELYTPDDLS